MANAIAITGLIHTKRKPEGPKTTFCRTVTDQQPRLTEMKWGSTQCWVLGRGNWLKPYVKGYKGLSDGLNEWIIPNVLVTVYRFFLYITHYFQVFFEQLNNFMYLFVHCFIKIYVSRRNQSSWGWLPQAIQFINVITNSRLLHNPDITNASSRPCVDIIATVAQPQSLFCCRSRSTISKPSQITRTYSLADGEKLQNNRTHSSRMNKTYYCETKSNIKLQLKLELSPLVSLNK